MVHEFNQGSSLKDVSPRTHHLTETESEDDQKGLGSLPREDGVGSSLGSFLHGR
jgi:hypothetical protein